MQNVLYVEAPPRRSAHPVRLMQAFAALAPAAVPRVKTPARALARSTGGRRLAAPQMPSRWSEEPAVVGAALLLCPPIGITLLWTSPRFSHEARIAVTVFLGFALSLVALIAVFRA